MIRNFITQLLARRRFWRYAPFGEVAELYASRVLRMAALYMISTFVSIYLYQIGFSIATIAFYWAAFYFFKVLTTLPIARLVAWTGPKRAIFISNLLYIPAMVAYALLPTHGVWLLLIAPVFQGISATMYAIAYNIDFSKVKSADHAGKQIAYMNIFEKVTVGLSPLIGGFIAFMWGPQVVIIISALLFAVAATPLFKTGEPVKVNQKLTFRGFPWRLLLGHAPAQFSVGFDVFTSGTVWSLHVAVIILGVTAASNDIYALSGLLLSVVFIVALTASYMYGKIIDRRKGGDLMRFGVAASAVTQIMRAFATTPVSAVGLNAASELATTGYTLPYTRALFDNADLSGARATYLGVVEMLANFGGSVGAVILGVLALNFGGESALQGFFFIAAVAILLIWTARFPLYKK